MVRSQFVVCHMNMYMKRIQAIIKNRAPPTGGKQFKQTSCAPHAGGARFCSKQAGSGRRNRPPVAWVGLGLSGSQMYDKLFVPQRLRPLADGIYRVRITTITTTTTTTKTTTTKSSTKKKLKAKKIWKIVVRDCVNRV